MPVSASRTKSRKHLSKPSARLSRRYVPHVTSLFRPLEKGFLAHRSRPFCTGVSWHVSVPRVRGRYLQVARTPFRDSVPISEQATNCELSDFQRAFGLSVSLMIFAATAIRSAVPRNVRALVALHVNTR